MPMLDTDLDLAVKAGFFAKIDADNGYWQIQNDPELEDIWTIHTPFGLYTSTRLLQGGVDGVAVFQESMSHVLDSLLRKSVLIWIDDVITFSTSPELLCNELRKIFQRFREYSVKINPRKTELFSTEISYCGRKISKDGIIPDDDKVSGLANLRLPQTVRDLQQFVSAANWLRSHIIDFSDVFGLLQSRLTEETKRAGTLKGNRLAKIPLDLTDDEKECFYKAKDSVINLTRLTFPKRDMILNLMTDASDLHWSVVLTQVSRDEMTKPVEERNHEPITFLSGSFSGSQLHWSVIEKECYPIIVAMDKLKHYLLTENPFHLFCDHRNLIYVLDPNRDLGKTTTDRLMRWATRLLSYR